MKNQKFIKITLMVSSISLFACTSITDSKQNTNQFVADTIQAQDEVDKEKKLNIENPKRLLPFTSQNVSNKHLKDLPQIDSITYWPLETTFDFNFNDYEALKKIDSFNVELPKRGIYNVYFTRLNKQNVPKSIRNSFVGLGWCCGFLILYNPAIKHAQFINLENDFYLDAGAYMQFQIDEDYQIHTEETEATDGEEATSTEIYITSKHLIKVDENGIPTIVKEY